jgi:hypothetical protein
LATDVTYAPVRQVELSDNPIQGVASGTRAQPTDREDMQEPEKQAKVSLKDAIRETQRKTHPLPM